MTRIQLVFLVSVIAFCGSITAALATISHRNDQLRGYEDATQTQNLPFRVPRLGVNAELTQYAPEDLAQQLAWMDAANITWIRQIFPWDGIEPEAGLYDWAVWDAIVEAVDTYPNFEIVAVLVNTPDWARRPNTTISGPPRNIDDFAAFAAAFAQRYASIIDHYQIWDEPNLASGWGNLDPRPADYAAMLQQTYTAIHNADSTASVMAAALAPTTEAGPRNISDIHYLQELYTFGISEFTDALAGKPYGFYTSPEDRRVSNSILNFSRLVALREVMVANGDGQKALWASHWGWNALPETWTGAASIWGSVTPQQQIAYTLEALTRADQEWPWLGGMILHHWQPRVPANDPQWGFAIISQENVPGDLWSTLSQRPTPSSAANGLFAPQSPYAEYSGVWTFGPLGADIGWINDSRLTFNFFGSNIALLLRRDAYVAYLYPLIDGELPNELPRDNAGNAYILLTSPDLQPEMLLVPIASGLDDGPHSLSIVTDKLVLDDSANRWALAGYAVSSGNPATPYNRQIIAAWLTAALAALSGALSARALKWRSAWNHINGLVQPLQAIIQVMLGFLASLLLIGGVLLTWGDGTPAIFRRDSVQLTASLLTAGLIYLQPGFILTIAGAGVLLILIFNRLQLGAILTLFWAPFFLFPVELYRFAFPVAEIILMITLLAWILHVLIGWATSRQHGIHHLSFKKLLASFKPLDWLVIVWVILGTVSLTWADYRAFATTELRTLIVQPALFYALARYLSRDADISQRLIDTLMIAGFVVAGISLIQFMRGEAIITAEGGARRLAGIYGSPNNLGLFLGRCIPIALAFTVSTGMDARRRIISAGMLIAMILAVILSQSVGALLIGVPISAVVVLMLALRKKAIPILAMLAVIFIIGMVAALQSPRFARLLDLNQGTNFYRIRVWESAINAIQDHPITGLGLDQFLYAYRGRYILPDAWEEPNLSHPHNFLLDSWIRLGIGGVIVLMVTQYFFWKQAISNLRSALGRAAPLRIALYIAVIGAMVNIMTHGLVDNSMYVLDLAYVYMLLFAVTINRANISAIDEKE